MKKEMSLKDQMSRISLDLFGEDCTRGNNAGADAVEKETHKAARRGEAADPNEKKTYSLLFTGEDYCMAHVEMTREEAMIVSRVLRQANEQVKGYCGRVYLNLDS